MDGYMGGLLGFGEQKTENPATPTGFDLAMGGGSSGTGLSGQHSTPLPGWSGGGGGGPLPYAPQPQMQLPQSLQQYAWLLPILAPYLSQQGGAGTYGGGGSMGGAPLPPPPPPPPPPMPFQGKVEGPQASTAFDRSMGGGMPFGSSPAPQPQPQAQGPLPYAMPQQRPTTQLPPQQREIVGWDGSMQPIYRR